MTICGHLSCKKNAVFGYNKGDKKLFCKTHASEAMINVKSMKCIFEECRKIPVFNLPGEIVGIYCKTHSKEDMIDVKSMKCIFEGCRKRPNFNYPSERTMLFCDTHKKQGMINISKNKCSQRGCKNIPLFGYLGKRKECCEKHKKEEMINLDLENKCTFSSVDFDGGEGQCENEFDFEIDGKRLCMEHSPREYEIALKRLCKWCDLEEKSKFVCKDCVFRSHKKEWSVVSQFRKEIRTPFIYDSSSMLGGCSKRRPDIYFELPMHCVIIEVDENQHKSYEDSCECARINEIVNGIGGKSIIFIRYNPDIVRNKGVKLNFKMKDKINYLIEIVKKELIREYDTFIIKVIQLFYDDNYDKYRIKKTEDITDIVSI